MFEDLRNAFREAVANFKEELNRDDVSGNVDRILSGMVDEVTSAKARLASLEEDVDKTATLLEKHNTELETCRRREQMAREIGDEETATVAAEYGVKLEGRIAILTKKLAVLTEEASLLRAEVDSMMRQLKEARTRRAGLTAEAGRTQTRESIGGAADLFDDFDRMEAAIEGDEADAEAAEAMGQVASEFSIDLDAPSGSHHDEIDYDVALEELKRRMKDV